MRYLIGAAALALLAALGAAIFALPRLGDEARLERQVVAELAAWTGAGVTVEGGTRVTLLPRPLVSLERLVVSGGAGQARLVADRLDLDLARWPLVTGRLEVETAHLVRPRLVAGLAAGDALVPALDHLLSALAAGHGTLPVGEVRLVDGSLADGTGDGPELRGLEGSLGRDAVTGSMRLALAARLVGAETLPLRLEGQIGRLSAGRPLPPLANVPNRYLRRP